MHYLVYTMKLLRDIFKRTITTRVHLVSQSIAKPSSPTPNHLRRYQLSSLDQVMVPTFIPWLLFYPGQTTNVTNKGRSELVKKSLSQTLSKFYPVAGRFRDNYNFVECNDEGVQFVEAKAKGIIFDVIQHRNVDDLNKLLPFESSQVNDLVSAVQVTHFDCGGTVIGLQFQHKIGDGTSSINFLNSWAAVARGNNHTSPHFDLAARFPPIKIGDFDHNFKFEKENVCAKWFMCDAKSIAALRDRYGENSDTAGKTVRPSKIEALTAFITGRIMAATQSVNSSDRTYLVHHPINLRPRMDPPLSKQHFGNIIVEPVVATADTKAKDGWCYGIIRQMRETVGSVDAEYVKKLKGEGYLDIMKKRAEKFKEENVNSIVFTSCCRFPLYDIDFGWGKPAWIGLGGCAAENFVVFYDSKVEGDIEVCVHLKDEVMANFENDEELRAFFSPIPSFFPGQGAKPEAGVYGI